MAALASIQQWVIPNRQYHIPLKWAEVDSLGWSAYDKDFTSLEGQIITIGIKIVPERTRLWANYVASPPKESCWPELATFINSIIERYNPEAVALFNEPDVDRDAAKWAEDFFGAWVIGNDFYAGGMLYGRMTAIVYPIVHNAHPNVRIIAGELMGNNNPTNPYSLTFLRGMVDGGLRADAISFHKYIGQGGNFNAAFELGEQIELITPLPQVLSETSVLVSPSRAKGGILTEALIQEQGAYMDYLKQHQGWSNINTIQWYSLAGNEWEFSDLIHSGVSTPAYEIWSN